MGMKALPVRARFVSALGLSVVSRWRRAIPTRPRALSWLLGPIGAPNVARATDSPTFGGARQGMGAELSAAAATADCQ